MNKLEKDLLKVIKKHGASYHQLTNAMKTVRAEADKLVHYNKPKSGKRLPQMPSMDQVKSLFKQFSNHKNVTYKLWGMVAFSTGLRVSELVNIKISDINWDDGYIFISKGKGDKDRYAVLLPEIKEMLKIYAVGKKVFLFEKPAGGQYTTRAVQKIFKICKDKAGIDLKLSPHIMRHLFLTALTEAGMNEGEIMATSGHSDKNSLAVYQHLAIGNIAGKVREAMGPKLRGLLVG